ncbi:SAM-dependent methyltransferase [Pseudorhizobium tarimense]|uniref:SAM-dependent methyltransferase n=1 Tax=Pseudorhizobium tarimense TaxID=1079109 RepID=A0ABV2H050_9HYPH|nr:class I SAM-dependent methyltransferase [Pseudorhizobium tarimense]MCJ8517274.1 class I SAM-dependent methyltransferase [Pseudorhizobium tarimense]
MNRREFAFDGQSLITPEAVHREIFSPQESSGEHDLVEAKAQVALTLSVAVQQVAAGQEPAVIIDRLIKSLHETRARYYAVWPELVPIVQNHPVSAYFHEDPFTRWSFEKPRGYSGDAHLIDFIYGHPSVADEIRSSSLLGQTLHRYTYNAPSAVAVRERRDLLTRYVDQVAAEKGPEAEILTIAAGHLREADRSVALKQGAIKRWVALDQDPMSVGATARDFQGTCVEAIDGSVRSMLTRSQDLGTFDFIYAAGLYDYLADKVAIKLTQTCLDRLKPGGMFLFANFSTEVPDDGYMETIMNWTLLLRSQSEMWNIINESVAGRDVETEVKFGANRNIIYGTIKLRT